MEGPLKAAGAFYRLDRYLLIPASAGGRISAFAAVGVIAIAYLLAARLGLALLLARSGVAVFWPASRLAAGTLVMLGPRARPALVIGVIVGTVAAGLLGSRALLTSIFNGIWNAGEAVLAAWLLERWFGQPFTFDNLRRVVGFLAAAGLATAASGVGGAFTLTLLHPETVAPLWEARMVPFELGRTCGGRAAGHWNCPDVAQASIPTRVDRGGRGAQPRGCGLFLHHGTGNQLLAHILSKCLCINPAVLACGSPATPPSGSLQISSILPGPL